MFFDILKVGAIQLWTIPGRAHRADPDQLVAEMGPSAGGTDGGGWSPAGADRVRGGFARCDVGIAIGRATSSVRGALHGRCGLGPLPRGLSDRAGGDNPARAVSRLFTADPAVRAAADLYLRWAGPGFAFVGLGLSLFFASQGSGKVLAPVLAGTVRLAVIALGGWALVANAAPAWMLFALVGVSMAAFGLSVATAVYRQVEDH